MNITLSDTTQVLASFQTTNILKTSAGEVRRALAEKREVVVVDLRAKTDYDAGHVPGAISLPPEQWNTAEGLDKSRLNIVYCYSRTCPLGGAACAELGGKGYPVVEMDGGFDIWQSSELDGEC